MRGIFRQAALERLASPEQLDQLMRVVSFPRTQVQIAAALYPQAVDPENFNELTEEMRSLYQSADVWISDCLSRRPHPTHTHLDAVLAWAQELGVGKVFLSHLNNSMDYATLVAELPDWATLAHDGLEIELT